MKETSQTGSSGREATEQDAWSDPREDIEIGVLMANGQLAPRTFSTWAQAEEWAWEGEQVVTFNRICSCDI